MCSSDLNARAPRKGEMTMPASKAQQRAVTKYVKNRYDRFGLTMPKGRLDEIKASAAAQGESVNGFINRAIDSQMGRDASSGPTEAPTALSEAGRLKLRPKGINLDGR